MFAPKPFTVGFISASLPNKAYNHVSSSPHGVIRGLILPYNLYATAIHGLHTLYHSTCSHHAQSMF